MTLLYTDPVFLEHDTGDHPECPRRLAAITSRLEKNGLVEKCTRPKWEAATPADLALVHDPQYVEAVARFAERGGGQIEADTWVSQKSYDVACRAAGAVLDAVRRVVSGEDKTALCLVRPPGHHALYDAPMGFCLFNNIAIGARFATAALGLDRVLIVEWDVHHGNGTQDAFYEDAQVGFLSIHRWPFYPGTGRSDETGSGAGLGTNLNIPVAFGTPRREFVRLFEAGLAAMADKMRPQLVLVSAGFDAHRQDPIGSLGLESEDFATLTNLVLAVAKTHAEGRVVSVLEGGYNPEMLAESVELHVRGLLGASV
ncbi:MAG: histone deacetylase [Planctomycetia bacterium]|nr:histone deacetylase [Planctomycetia bacterium]